MIGRTPDNITAIRPLKDGVIADFEATEQMLRYFIQQVHRRRYFAKPRMVICVPERHHRGRAARGQGGRLPGRRPPGLHHRGADGRRDRRRAARPRGHRQHGRRRRRRHHRGRRDLASAASSPACRVRTAGDDLDQAIIAWMKKEHSPDARRAHRRGDQDDPRLGLPAARASPRPRSAAATWSPACRAPSWSPAPRSARRSRSRCTPSSTRSARTLDQTPPELAGDIMDRGIVLTGGGALLRGLDERLRHETGMPVHVAEDPLTSVAHGRRQVRRGVRGAPAGPGRRPQALLMRLGGTRLTAASTGPASRAAAPVAARRAGAGLRRP